MSAQLFDLSQKTDKKLGFRGGVIWAGFDAMKSIDDVLGDGRNSRERKNQEEEFSGTQKTGRGILWNAKIRKRNFRARKINN